MSERDYEMCEPFGIDNGELDGLSPQECFVLGYEMAMIHHVADMPAEHDAEMTVHVDNKARIEDALMRRGRAFEWKWPCDDSSEGWIFLRFQTIKPR